MDTKKPLQESSSNTKVEKLDRSQEKYARFYIFIMNCSLFTPLFWLILVKKVEP